MMDWFWSLDNYYKRGIITGAVVGAVFFAIGVVLYLRRRTGHDSE